MSNENIKTSHDLPTTSDDMSNKKMKTSHDLPTTTNVALAPPRKASLLQHYRFSTVAYPGENTNTNVDYLASSGSFTGTFAIALTLPHDPNSPVLLPYDDEEEIDQEEFDSDPYINVVTANLLEKDKPILNFSSIKTTCYMASDETVDFDFTFITDNHEESENSIEMVCTRNHLSELVTARGGYLELSIDETEMLSNVNKPSRVINTFRIPRRLKLYCVIASEPLPSVTDLQLTGKHWRKPDAISFWVFMLGTHARLGANSPAFMRSEDLVREVFKFMKVVPDFEGLEKRVATWMKLPKFYNGYSDGYLKLFGPGSDYKFRDLTATDLVREYKRFLKLKCREKDWSSEILSPPMIHDGYTGLRILDEVWHLHLSSTGYHEDIQLFTEGNQIQHHPVLRELAEQRYIITREMAVKDIEVNNEKSNGVLLSSSDKWNRLWPEVPESDSDGYGSGGSDPSDGCC